MRAFFERDIEENGGSPAQRMSFLEEWHAEREASFKNSGLAVLEIFGVRSKAAPKLPSGSVLHLGILNSLQLEFDSSICCYSNTGGFGIDGCVSSLLGASLASSEQIVSLLV